MKNKIRFLAMMLIGVLLSVNQVWGETYTKATSLKAGDKIVLVCEATSQELTGISTTSTKYGLGTSYTTSVAGTYVLDVVAGSETNSFSFKIGDNYLRWNSGNSLDAAATSVAKNSSWIVTFDTDGNATIKNANDEARVIWWNVSSPRFACYTGKSDGKDYNYVQIYKQESSCTEPATPLSISASPTSIALNKTSTIAANGGNGGTISYEVSPATGSVSAGTFSATATGTYTITATQAVNAGKCAQEAQCTVTVTSITYTDYLTECTEPTQVATPTFSPTAGTYSGAQTVTITCSTEGAVIHYTTDGTTPTASSSTYSSAITVNGDMTIKAIAVKGGMTDSEVATAAYVINYTVTFDANGHGSDPAAVNAKYNQTITAPTAPTASGWVFGGWYKEQACTNAWNFATDKVTSSITLYAKWTHSPLSSIAVTGQKTSFYIGESFSFDGTCTATYEDGSKATVTPTNTSVNVTTPFASVGSGTATITYTEGGVTKTTTYSITIAALPTWTITLNTGSGTLASGTTEIVVVQGQSTTLPSCEIDCEDSYGEWEFAGWKTGSGVETITTTAQDFVATEYTPNSNITLYAVYKAVDASGGTTSETCTGKTSSSTGTWTSPGWGSQNSWNGKYGTCAVPENATAITNITIKAASDWATGATLTVDEYNNTTFVKNIAVQSRLTGTSSSTLVNSSITLDPSTTKIRFTGNAKNIYLTSIAITFTKTASVTRYWSIPCNEKYTMTFHGVGGDASTIDWTGSLGSEDDYMELNATTITAYPTCATAETGWTFLGWRTSDYNDGKELDEESASTENPGVASIYKNGKGYALNSGTTEPCGDGVRCVDMYPVFTKFVENDKPEIATLASGSKYYMYYTSDAAGYQDDYSSLDGQTTRIYAHEFSSNAFSSTTLCESAQLFEFTKRADGNWDIRMRNAADDGYVNQSYIYTVADNTDLYTQAAQPSYGWAIEAVTIDSKTMVKMQYAGNTNPKRFMKVLDGGGSSASGTFKNYDQDCAVSSMYHAIYLGSCSNRIFSSNPGHAATWEVYGDFTDDETANFVGYPMTNGMLVVQNLAANTTYQFKLRKTTDGTNYTWFGDKNESNTYTTSGVEWTLDGSAGGHNVNLVTGAAGSYTFTASHMSAEFPGITVTYPTAYTITFDGNGNDGGSMTNVTNIAAGENVTLDANDYTKTGNHFKGWVANVDVKIGGETKIAGTLIADAATIQDINSNITLIAQWETAVTAIVISNVYDIHELTVGSTLQLDMTLTPASPEYGGPYTWYTSNGATMTVDQNGLVTGVQANTNEYIYVRSASGIESNHYIINVKSSKCDEWGLHYWNDEHSSDGDLCFVPVVGGAADEYRTEGLFSLPSNSNSEWVKVLYNGMPQEKSADWHPRWVPMIGLQGAGCGGDNGAQYAGQDAIGYFRIYTNSIYENYFLAFQPVYAMTFGVDGQAGWVSVDFAHTNGAEYGTEIVEIPSNFSSLSVYVGTKRADVNPGVTSINDRSKTVLMNTVPNMTSGDFAGKFGKFYIKDNSCEEDNFDLLFTQYYRLHYDLDGGETAAAYDDQFAWSLAEEGDRTFALAATPTNDGYTFLGWSVSIGGGAATTMQPGTDVILTDDAVATAIWAQNFTVTYEVGGYSSSCSGSTTHYCGEENITVCDNLVVPTGFTFNGWTSNVEIGGKTSFQGGNKFTMPCSNVVFTSNVTADEYHITYNGLEGATHSNPPTYTVESEFTFADPSARTGYSFVGWFDAATDGNQVTGIVLGSTGDTTVWAYWTAKQYTVTLDANYTAGTNGSVNFTYGTKTKSAYTAVSNKFGYTLLGYYTLAENGVKILDANGDIEGTNKSGWIDADGNWIRTTADSKLYAHWSAITGIDYYVYHYKMNADGTYPSEPTAQTSGKGKTDEVKTNLEPNVYEGFVTPEHQDLTIVYGGENILRYYYERNKYELTWNFDGGTPAGDYTQGQVYHGADITYPTSVSKDGYCFMGWDITPTTMPMAATTITAQWAAYENYRTYCGNAVTFVANGGMGDDYVVTVDAEKLTNIPTVETAGFTREGYGFAGWMVNGDESKTVYAPGATINPITDGMIVNAVWISNPTINEAIPAITSTNNVAIASAQRTLTVNNPDGLEATIHIAYKKNGEDVLPTNSEFRFCNTGGTISENNITSTATSIATDFTIQYKPNTYNKIDDDYTLYITVTRTGSAATVSSAEFNLKGRSLPEKFVIAVQNNSEQWLALPANMTDPCTPAGMPITVTGEGLEMTADASLAVAYSLTGHNFAKDSAFFKSAYNNGELWASKTGNNINDNTTTVSSSNRYNFEWGLTPTDETLISYNMANQNNGSYLRYYNDSKFGMYASGVNAIYFIAVTQKEETTAVVDEWYKNKILFHLPFAMKSVSMTINGVAVPDADITIAERKIKTTDYVLYELGGNIDLVAASGQVMELIIGDGTTEYAANISIPQIIVGEVEGCAALPAKADVVVRDGGHLTIDVEGAMAKSFNNVTIYPNSKISVPEGKYFNVKSLTFFGGIDEWYDTEESEYVETNIYAPELSLKGTMKADTLIYRMRVNAEHMMPVSFPYDVTINKIVREDKLDSPSWGKVGTDIRLETYNGELRAAGNRRESDESTWTEIKEGTLTAGIGYTVAAQNRFKNYPYTILDFPMANPYKSAAAEEMAKNADVTAHDAVNWYDKGWNLMGNPYMAGITGAGAIKVNETDYDFVYIPTADGEDYYQGPITTAKILPFKDFFVQVNKGGTMYFDLTKRVDAPARMLADIERTAQFSIGLAGANKTDITYFKVADNFTESYDIPGDNAKMFGSAVNTKVYSLLNGEDQLAQMALNADMTAQPIQLGYIAPENGEYIFALDNTYTDYQNVEHIYLLENGEIKVDLLNAQYTFTTEAKTEDERFAILIVMKGAKMPTDLMDGLFDNDVASPKKVIYNDHFYILNTNRRVYDGTGKYINKMQKNK